MLNQKKLKILFNDSHSNHPKNKNIPQGGPSRFVKIFINYFSQNKNIYLASFFFSHNSENQEIFSKKITSKKQHDFYELVYPAEKIKNIYKSSLTKKQFLEFLAPWVNEIEKTFAIVQPDVLFLNGYSLSNYILFCVANKNNIPTVIQHAGIWKKEIKIGSGNAFSSEMQKVLSSLEKDLARGNTYHIFLNEFSKQAFCNIHNINNLKNKHTTIPLPVVIEKPRTFKIKDIKKIGSVARWDAIKNHSALLRLGKYLSQKNIPIAVTAVTQRFNGISSDFRKEYLQYVNIIDPMEPKKLINFYRSQDITLIPSNFDVSPTVVIESIIQGIPVIISSQTGWVDVYKKFKLEKLIIDPKDSGQKIFEIIKFYQENQKNFIPKFEKLQRYIIETHDPDKVFRQYEKIFTSF